MKNKTLVKTAKKKKQSSQISLSPSQKKIEKIIGRKTSLKASDVHRAAKPVIEYSPDIYKDIIENIHEGIFEVDLKGHFTFVNDAVCRATGFTKKKLTGMNSRPFTDKDDDKKVIRAYGTVYKTGIPVRGLGWHIIRKDGEKRYIEGSIYLRKDPKGKPTGFRVIATDVTERKKTEDAYKIASLEWQETFDAVSDAICLMDNNQRIVRSNRAMCTMFGKSQKDFLGKHCWEIVHGTRKPIDECPIIKSKDSLKKEEIELKIKNKWLNIIVYPLLNDQKILSGFVHIIRDITEMKRAEESALKEYDFNRTVFDSLSVPFFMIDTVNWHFVRWNKIFPGLIGYSDDELAKFRPRNIIPKSEIGTLIKAQNKFLAEGHVSFEMPLVSKNGTTTPYLLSGTLLHYYRKSYLIGIGINLTERKKSEEALKQTEHKFRTIFDHASDGILLARSSDKKLIEANEKICQMLGYSKEELLQLDISNIHPKESSSFITEQFISLIKKEISIVHDLPVIKKDKTIFFADVTASTINYGGTECHLGMFRDVTERKKAEEELRQSRESYRRLFEDHAAVKLIIDPDTGSIIDTNRAAVEYYGWTREEMRQMKISDINILAPEELKIEMAKARDQRRFHFEFKHRLANGSIRDVEVYSSAIEMNGKNVLHSIVNDVTDRKQVEESLRKSDARFKNLFENSPVGVFLLKDRKFTDVNPAFCEMSGYSREEIIGQSFEIGYKDTEEFERVGKLIYQEVEKNGIGIANARLKRKDGDLFDAMLYLSLLDAEDPSLGFQCIVIDITEQKLAEEKIRIEEQRFRGITQNMPGVIYQFYAKDNGEYGVSFISEPFNEFAQIMSKSEVEKLDSVFSDFCSRIHEEDKEKFLTSIKEAVENVSLWNFEGRVFTKSGQLIWIQATSIPTRLEDRVVFDGIILNITDRRNAEEAALKELNFSNTVLETLPGPYYMFDFEQARFFRWNRNMSIAAGYSDEELLHMTPFDLVPKSEHDIIIKAMEKIFNEGTNISEFNVVSKDGSTTPYLLSGNLLNFEGKLYVVGMGINIAERKKMEEALQKSEANLRYAQEEAHVGSWEFDAVQQKPFWSEEMFRIVGRDPALGPMSLEDFVELVHPDERKRVYRDVAKCFTKNLPYHHEYRIFKPDNKTAFIESRGNAITDDKGNVIRIFGILQDVTERKRTEETLILIKKAVESSSDAIGMSDPQGHHFYHNKAFTELFEYTPEELDAVGGGPVIYLNKDTAHEVFDTIMKGGSWSGELEMISKSGRKFPVLLRADVIIDENNKLIGLIGVHTDITERKIAEEEIIRLNETLEQRIKERTAELEAFSYSVSHDLRAPLRTVHGFGQALLEDYENQLDEEAKGYLGRIKRATETMGELIEDMLKLSRITRAEMDIVPVNLSNIVKSITEELQTSQPERRVEIKIADGLEDLADPRLIRIAFENLLSNSWKFTAKNDNVKIEFGLTLKNDKKVYFIRDNGAGFDMEYAGKLFTPFQRYHNAEEYAGTGIGLAIVKRIIIRHGGRIWAESNVGEGTTIFFTLNE